MGYYYLFIVVGERKSLSLLLLWVCYYHYYCAETSLLTWTEENIGGCTKFHSSVSKNPFPPQTVRLPGFFTRPNDFYFTLADAGFSFV